MRQLEMIHLRMAGRSPDRLLHELRRSLHRRAGAEVRIYRQAGASGDICVHVYLPCRAGSCVPSDLGLSLAAALREHGMVEHTLWLEERDDRGGETR